MPYQIINLILRHTIVQDTLPLSSTRACLQQPETTPGNTEYNNGTTPQKHLHHSSWNYDSEKLWKKGAERL